MDFDLVTFVNTMLGGFVGGIAGWLITHWYAKRSSDELMTVFRVFAAIAKEHGLAEFVLDKHGRITTGRVIRLTATSTITMNATGDLTVRPAKPPHKSG